MSRIAVGFDHAGFAPKQHLANVLRDIGHEVRDLGPHPPDRVDYPHLGEAVGRAAAGGAAAGQGPARTRLGSPFTT